MDGTFPLGYRRCSTRAGFTLVELLVSMAVLLLLFGLVSQFVGDAGLVIGNAGKDMSADEQARMVFNRMGADLAGMLTRPDADSEPYDFTGITGNEALFFYSQAPAYFAPTSGYYPATYTYDPKDPISLVGYRIAVDPNRTGFYQLQRLGKGLTWDQNGTTAGSVVLMTYPFTTAGASNVATNPGGLTTAWSTVIGTSPTFTNGTDANSYHVIADQVFRLSFCFLMKTGSFSLKRDPTQGFADVSAIVAAIAILDTNSRLLVHNLDQLVAAFPNPTAQNLVASTGGPQLMDVLWQQQINTPGFAASVGLPPLAASKIRVYQRYFYLNTVQRP